MKYNILMNRCVRDYIIYLGILFLIISLAFGLQQHTLISNVLFKFLYIIHTHIFIEKCMFQMQSI